MKYDEFVMALIMLGFEKISSDKETNRLMSSFKSKTDYGMTIWVGVSRMLPEPSAVRIYIQSTEVNAGPDYIYKETIRQLTKKLSK